MSDALLLALLVAAVAIGWWLGRRERHSTSRSPSPSLARDYFVGLNYLLNDQQDQAIETFIGALEVNSDTIETHIALGNLFRARGEADRAVRIHQNLLARPTLNVTQGERIQLELSRDFLNLGLHDRAERLLQSLVNDASDAHLRQAARLLLVDLFEREAEWQAALDTAQPHLIQHNDDIQRAAAHWLCEIAEQARRDASPALARRHLKQALAMDPACIRANLLLAEMAHHTGHYRDAIRLLMRIPDQDKTFIPTMLEPLRLAYQMLDDDSGLISSLEQLLEYAPYTSIIILLAETLRHRDGNSEAAHALVTSQLNREPSLGAVDYLMGLYHQTAQGDEDERILLLQRHTKALLSALPRHRCQRCGFSGDHLHWQCPSCRTWGTTKPITGIDGE
jgi:lipopolysaccharide biosynthesis regulator YciM